MRITIKQSVLALLLSVASNTGFADDFFLGAPDDSGSSSQDCDDLPEGCVAEWEGSVEFGYVAVSGNQDTTSLNGRFSLAYELEKWRHEGFMSTITSSSESTDQLGNVTETTSEKYNAQAKSLFKYSPKAYAFGIFEYDNTRNSGFEYQSSIAFGAGYKFINSKVYKLDGELGFGRRTSETEATDLIRSTTNSESITRLAGKFAWKISKSSVFEQKVSSEIGDTNTITKSLTGLSANLIENLAMKLSYTVKHQSDVPVNSEKTETITSFTVVYSF
jgi:putative salt-induced outer membrane protein